MPAGTYVVNITSPPPDGANAFGASLQVRAGLGLGLG